MYFGIKKMGKSINISIGEKYHLVSKEANYYDSTELDYYKLDAINQAKNSSDAYHIQDPKEYKC